MRRHLQAHTASSFGDSARHLWLNIGRWARHAVFFAFLCLGGKVNTFVLTAVVRLELCFPMNCSHTFRLSRKRQSFVCLFASSVNRPVLGVNVQHKLTNCTTLHFAKVPEHQHRTTLCTGSWRAGSLLALWVPSRFDLGESVLQLIGGCICFEKSPSFGVLGYLLLTSGHESFQLASYRDRDLFLLVHQHTATLLGQVGHRHLEPQIRVLEVFPTENTVHASEEAPEKQTRMPTCHSTDDCQSC